MLDQPLESNEEIGVRARKKVTFSGRLSREQAILRKAPQAHGIGLA